MRGIIYYISPREREKKFPLKKTLNFASVNMTQNRDTSKRPRHNPHFPLVFSGCHGNALQANPLSNEGDSRLLGAPGLS